MPSKKNRKLSQSLWLVVAIAALPAILLALLDYQNSYRVAVDSVTSEIRQELSFAKAQEKSAVREVRLIFEIMAHADDMNNLNSDECSGLAQRLVSSIQNVSNLGASLPNGDVFCSAKEFTGVVKTNDRKWFIEGQEKTGLGYGQYIVGRISGLRSITFPYSVRNPDGSLRAILFMGTQPT